jgi:protein involved in polysaccharide export with SLBB domain
MIRLFTRGSIAVLLLCLSGFLQGARAVEPAEPFVGIIDTDRSVYEGRKNGVSVKGAQIPPQKQDLLKGLSVPQVAQEGVLPAEVPSAAKETAAAKGRGPLPEGQSAFEQIVSGKVEITRDQLEVIRKDPEIAFLNSIPGSSNGAAVVPVRIVDGSAARAATYPGFMASETVDVAGYLVGPRHRISEAFRLLGIASPFSISMDLKHFGLDMFQQARSGFLTTSRLPVGPEYVLGPEDEVKIQVWGRFEGSWSRRIDRDGTIQLPKIGLVSLAGLTFGQAREVLFREFSKFYTGFEMNVTLGVLKTMTVYVVGNVRQPGAYDVSSLATLVNALMQAGGPSKSGSMRDIQIRRGGMIVAHYDMYDLLRNGDKSSDPRLLPEDVVFVPPIGPVAAIAGSVNRPALYELRGERTVSQLVELAGGLNVLAFRGRLQIERIVESNRQIVFESDLAESRETEVDLRSGDILKVFQVVPDRRTVRISGAVLREGEYGFTAGMTVKDLVALSGGTKHYAYMQEAELSRQFLSQEGPRVEKVNIDLEKAMAGDPASNLPLQESDRLFVRTIPEWSTYTQVSILGEVRFPGTYTARKGERLSSLIERAGGFTADAYPRGAVFTRVSVREAQQKVINESADRLERDLVAQAGALASVSTAGLEGGAAGAGAEMLRVRALVEKLRGLKAQGRMVLEISPPDRMRNTLNDIELENGDVLSVPRNPRSVHATGAVFNPSTFVYDEKKDLEDYVEMAGGYTEIADKDRIYVLKVNGSAVRPDGGFFLFPSPALSSADGGPLLESGDTIVVPERIVKIAWLQQTKEISSILFQAVMAAGVVIAAF